MVEEIWYEGYKASEICHKCMKNKPIYCFVGMPITEPNVVIWLCEECFETMPKNIFKLPLEIQGEL
jgi:hypothetical protein